MGTAAPQLVAQSADSTLKESLKAKNMAALQKRRETMKKQKEVRAFKCVSCVLFNVSEETFAHCLPCFRRSPRCRCPMAGSASSPAPAQERWSTKTQSPRYIACIACIACKSRRNDLLRF